MTSATRCSLTRHELASTAIDCREDRHAPFGHGEWLSDHTPDVEAVLTDDGGHLALTANHLEGTHEWLLSHL
jgi:hypothetical protein